MGSKNEEGKVGEETEKKTEREREGRRWERTRKVRRRGGEKNSFDFSMKVISAVVGRTNLLCSNNRNLDLWLCMLYICYIIFNFIPWA